MAPRFHSFCSEVGLSHTCVGLMQGTLEGVCHIPVLDQFASFPPCEPCLALDSDTRSEGQGSGSLLAKPTFLGQRPSLPSSLFSLECLWGACSKPPPPGLGKSPLHGAVSLGSSPAIPVFQAPWRSPDSQPACVSIRPKARVFQVYALVWRGGGTRVCVSVQALHQLPGGEKPAGPMVPGFCHEP